MITNPKEQEYWNELVEHKEEMSTYDLKAHNYRMSVQEVPIIAGTVTLNNKTYNMWLLGNEAYCYAPELASDLQQEKPLDVADVVKFVSNGISNIFNRFK